MEVPLWHCGWDTDNRRTSTFSRNTSFHPTSLRDSIPYLKHAEMTQFQDNPLTAVVDRNGPVKLSFFGSLGIKRAQDPDVVEENGVQVASILDLLASKLKTVQLRAQAKDYRDVLRTLEAGLSLAEGLAAAAAIYGKEFNGALSLKALTLFEDGDPPSLTRTVQKRLLEAATSVNLRELPTVVARSWSESAGRIMNYSEDLKRVAKRVVWFKAPE